MAVPSLALAPIQPRDEHITKRLEQILRRGSLNVGGLATTDRLMLMMTRSCDLRCTYCMVGLSEEAYGVAHSGEADPVSQREVPEAPRGDMSIETLRRSIDLLMTSVKPRLGVQLFGGEPSRRWDELVEVLEYATHHPRRQGRLLELLFTTNGVNLTPERLARLAALPVILQYSLDGDERGSRFRRGHLLAHDEAVDRMQASIEHLNASGVRWFMNATLPPAAAGEVMARYAWARANRIPALQMNYATGMWWTPEQMSTWLDGVQEMLFAHHQDPGTLELFNWRNDADPVPLCGDVIVDVDGSIYQVGALFHERRFPKLKHAYRRGHLSEVSAFTGLRLTLIALWARTQEILADAPKDLATFEQNIRLGAATDLVVQLTKKRLGRDDKREERAIAS